MNTNERKCDFSIRIERGDIFIVDLGELNEQTQGSASLKKTRPCVIISDSSYNKYGRIMVAPIKSNNTDDSNDKYLIDNNDCLVPIEMGVGTKFVVINRMVPVNRSDLKRYMGTINNQNTLHNIDIGIMRYMFGNSLTSITISDDISKCVIAREHNTSVVNNNNIIKSVPEEIIAPIKKESIVNDTVIPNRKTLDEIMSESLVSEKEKPKKSTTKTTKVIKTVANVPSEPNDKIIKDKIKRTKPDNLRHLCEKVLSDDEKARIVYYVNNSTKNAAYNNLGLYDSKRVRIMDILMEELKERNSSNKEEIKELVEIKQPKQTKIIPSEDVSDKPADGIGLISIGSYKFWKLNQCKLFIQQYETFDIPKMMCIYSLNNLESWKNANKVLSSCLEFCKRIVEKEENKDKVVTL